MEQDFTDDNEIFMDEAPIPNEVFQKIDIYTTLINTFKKKLYEVTVQNNTTQSANSLKPIYEYHAVYLHCLGYWISILDNLVLKAPEIKDTQLQEKFNEITQKTVELNTESHDSRTLTYNVLLKKSTEHPYIFINNE